MAEPVDDERKLAIVVAVHSARDYLSIAERAADSGVIYYGDVLEKIQGADDALGTARALCGEVDLTKTERARELLSRAREAAKAAYHQGSIARSYADKQSPSEFEERQAKKTRQILRRAAEAARQETHRALAELLAIFPDAYAIDDTEEDA